MTKWLDPSDKAIGRTFLVVAVLAAAIAAVTALYKLDLLDGTLSPERVKSLVTDMSPQQRGVHAVVTGTLDVLLPLAYGLLFAQVAARTLGRFARGGQVLCAVMVLADFAEGIVQILALGEDFSLLALKPWLTGVKFVLVGAGVVMTAGWLLTRVRQRARGQV